MEFLWHASLLDQSVLVRDGALCLCDYLLGLVNSALWCVLVEGYKETLLHVDGADANDGGEEQEHVADQLHRRGVESVDGGSVVSELRAERSASCGDVCAERTMVRPDFSIS